MVFLDELVRSFIDDDRVISAASELNALVHRLRLSDDTNRLEIVLLDMDQNVSELQVKSVEAALRKHFRVDGVRLVCPFTYQRLQNITLEKSSNGLTPSDESSGRRVLIAYEERLKQETQAILAAQKQFEASTKSNPESENTGPSAKKRKKDVDSSATQDKDSWEYKASLQKTENTPKFVPKKKDQAVLWGRMSDSVPLVKIGSLDSMSGMVRFEGKFEIDDFKLTRSGHKVCAQFFATDDTGSIPCIAFLNPQDADIATSTFKKGAYARVQANVYFDSKYSRDLSASIEGVMQIDAPPKRKDLSEEKRVELHVHTKMSDKDAVINISELLETAAEMGHPACAITDHGVVQAFPEAAETVRKIRKKVGSENFQMIYGMEGYLLDDGDCAIYNADPSDPLLERFVAIDIEKADVFGRLRPIKITAHRYLLSELGDFLPESTFQIDTSSFLSHEIVACDTEENSKSALAFGQMLRQRLGELSAYIGHDVLVADDVFDVLKILREEGYDVDIEAHQEYRVKFNMPAADAKRLLDLPRLDFDYRPLQMSLVEEDGVTSTDTKARSVGQYFAALLKHFCVHTAKDLNDRVGKVPESEMKMRKHRTYHIIFLVENELGLYHLYRLVSESHLRFYGNRPRIPKSLLEFYRDGLIIGSACEAGEVFVDVLKCFLDSAKNSKTTVQLLSRDPAFLRKLNLYDYLEIQPACNNEFYLRDPESGINTIDELRELNRIIVALGDTLHIPVCATTDAHFLEKEEGEYRKYILMEMQYKDAQQQSDLYFRTTDEMLNEFSYLGDEKAREVVITQPCAIAKRTSSDIIPFPNGTYPPIITSAADDIRRITWDKAKEWYEFDGKISEIVEARVNKELDSIIGNGFAIMYYIAYMLVKKSNEDGYIVGSRGSVGSSLVATLCGISEVNPLPPHYLCNQCCFSEFDLSGEYGSGYDLPEKSCPHCGAEMTREGQEIPFETFLGFFGDKQPDIDLNFSSEYQSRAHKYVEELFGTSHTFRAGTIGCYAEKNAIGTVLKATEQMNQTVNRAELRRRSMGLIGVKRTTGQHPGGIVVVPKEMDVYEFTPIQYPANKSQGNMVTTHFDFKAMHDTILKLDILGHYDPTVLRMLSDLTGIDVRTIPIPDPKVMALFTSTESLGISPGSSDADSGTLGLSEMGTFMARDMISETKPSTFYELVQLMGLSHGTDVWKGNAQELIRNQTCTLKNVIGCRDSIMTYLINCGLENKAAFDIMERVRKGRGLLPEQEKAMRDSNVPDWYIESCKKIKYMFPKAHAAAYAISSLRIAWFKVYYPEEYYCAFFSIRADEFDGEMMLSSMDNIIKQRKELYDGFSKRKQKEQAQYYLLELVEEMYRRGITFDPISIEKSHSHRFLKTQHGKILPPLNTIPSVSTAMAESIVRARDEKPFKTRDDLSKRSGIGPSTIDKIATFGIIDHLPESEQIDLFSLF